MNKIRRDRVRLNKIRRVRLNKIISNLQSKERLKEEREKVKIIDDNCFCSKGQNRLFIVNLLYLIGMKLIRKCEAPFITL